MSTPGYRDRLKSTITRVARELLSRDGLQGLQARRVAQGADCSVGTIYNLFGNLDMVVIAANAETLAELHSELQAIIAATSGTPERLTALSQTYLQFALKRTLEWRAIFEHRFATKTTVPDWYRESQGELFAIVEEVLTPEIPSPEQRSEAARALFSAVHGVIAIALDEKLGEFQNAQTERQVQFVVQSIARGISHPQT